MYFRIVMLTIIFTANVQAADLLLDTAGDIATDTSSFNGVLNGASDDVQKSLDGIDDITTDKVPEGATNKYFNGKTTDNLPEGTNKYENLSDNTTDDLAEGATSKYLNGHSFAGDVTGQYTATIVGNDSHTHSSSTIGDEYLRNSGGDVGTGDYTFTGNVSVGDGDGDNPKVRFIGTTIKEIYFDQTRGALIINAGKVIIE